MSPETCALPRATAKAKVTYESTHLAKFLLAIEKIHNIHQWTAWTLCRIIEASNNLSTQSLRYHFFL